MNKRGKYDYWTLVVRTRLRAETRNCGPFPDQKENRPPDEKEAGQLNQTYVLVLEMEPHTRAH